MAHWTSRDFAAPKRGCLNFGARVRGSVQRLVTITSLNDMLDDGTPIDVMAEVRFLSTSEGGKTGAVRGIYRPNHNFGLPENRITYIGQIEFAPGDEVAPGEDRRVRIRFLGGGGLRELLSVGREWRIQEGSHLVAHGRVVELLSGPRQRPRRLRSASRLWRMTASE